MIFQFLRTSLIALAILAVPGLAMAQTSEDSSASEAQAQDAGAEARAAAVKNFISQTREKMAKLPAGALRKRLDRTRQYAASETLAPDLRSELENLAGELAAETERRNSSAEQQPAIEEPQQQKAAPEEAATQTGNEAEQPASQTGNEAEQPASQSNGVQLDASKGNPEAEAKARVLLDESVPADRLTKQALRERLEAMRDLLAGNQLSNGTERQLRRRLADDRKIMRGMVAVEEQQQQTNAGEENADVPVEMAPPEETFDNGQPSASKQKAYFDNPKISAVLNDDRPSRALKVGELRLRIDVLRGAVRDRRFDPADREIWQERLDQDRRALRFKLENRKEARRAELRRDSGNFDIDVGIVFQPGRPAAQDVFAAEVDDEEIEDVLVAPPRRKIARRYSVEDIERQPELRDAVARIELDTVRFGFGEAFLREEEIDALDRIAEVMEKILAVHPGEVFLIEGHTDAVGSDASNLNLSRQRAAAVKQALTAFYVIPPENLKTIGYGERFLRIPTSEPEAENRRVSVARITALVGEVDDLEQ